MGAGYAQYSPNRHNGSGSSSSVPPFAPLSIYTVYAPEIRQLSTIERRDLSNYVTKATRRLGKMLQVRKTDSLMVDCRQVGKKEVKDGYNFALFIDVNCKGNGQTLATAGACAREIGRAEPNGSVFYPYHQGQFQSSRGVTWLGRPLGGRISICLDQFKVRPEVTVNLARPRYRANNFWAARWITSAVPSSATRSGVRSRTRKFLP